MVVAVKGSVVDRVAMAVAGAAVVDLGVVVVMEEGMG